MRYALPLYILFFALLTLVFGSLSVGESHAETARTNVNVKQAESYLRNIGTAKARFTQTNPDGTQLNGTFYLSRPGKLRFEYDPPIKDFIVADGAFIYFYDAEMGEQTNAPIGQTLADFILRPDLRLSGDLQVTETSHAGGFDQITLVQSNDPLSGELKLGFETAPYRLSKWRITDAQGMITEVALTNLELGAELPRKLFVYHAPQSDTPTYNF